LNDELAPRLLRIYLPEKLDNFEGVKVLKDSFVIKEVKKQNYI